MAGGAVTDLMDHQQLLALAGEQTCECRGTYVSSEECDVVDGEVTCLDCVWVYYPQVYARRTGEVHE